MNFRTMVIKTVFGVFAEQKHGCQRRNTDFINGFYQNKNHKRCDQEIDNGRYEIAITQNRSILSASQCNL